MYKHGMMTREKFEQAYCAYMNHGNYTFADYDVEFEWRRYERGRSWFAAQLDFELTKK